jgi:hypothetical protein
MSAPSVQREPTAVRVVVVSGQRAPYDMFDVDGVEAGAVRVRGPLLLEVGEEVSLRIERGGESAVVKARVASHDTAGDEAVTTLSIVDDAVPERLRG